MKTYFKNANSRAYLILDTETSSAITMSKNDTLQIVTRTLDTTAYNNFTTESTDETKWIPISESVVEALKQEIITLL